MDCRKVIQPGLTRALAFLLALGSLCANAAEPSGTLPFRDSETVEYREPKGIYTIRVPKGYELRNESAGTRSKIWFRYGPDAQLGIISSVMNKDWNAEAEMKSKMDSLRNGATPLGKMNVVRSGLIQIGGGSGYEYVVSSERGGTTSHVHGYALVGHGRSLSIVCEGQGGQAETASETLARCVTASLAMLPPAPDKTSAPVPSAVRSPPGPAGSSAGRASASSPEEPALEAGSDQAWAKARASIAIKAFMISGGQAMIMVNNQILRAGDTLTVRYAGHDYTFTVKTVEAGRQTAEFEPVKQATQP